MTYDEAVTFCKKHTNSVFVHARTQKRYRLLNVCKVENESGWHDGVVYAPEATLSPVYVRYTLAFTADFDLDEIESEMITND